MVKHFSIIFLQIVIVLTGLAALTILIWLPLTEGRATNSDLFSVYSDPFIIYGYVASAIFFITLYKAFKLLGYIREDKAFTLNSVKTTKSIKYCAIVLGILIIAAGLYIKIFHHKDDDPAGFLAICIVTAFISIVIAAVTEVFEKILQNGIKIKSASETDLQQTK